MFPSSRLAAFFDLPLAVIVGFLIWRSLDWPLVGDATIFHFIARQMQMGAVPYRDIVDVNMPLTYYLDLAVVTIGGTGDLAWRVFDLTAAAVAAVLILMLLWPAGPAAGLLAVLVVLATHLLLGPYMAGQRDFVMSIVALAAAVASATAAEAEQRRGLHLLLAGAAAMTAAAIKPTGVMLLLLPALATRLRWRDAAWIAAGAAIVAGLVVGTLATAGSLGAFVTMTRTLLPLYGSLDVHSVPEVLASVYWIAPVAGLAVAALLNLGGAMPPRVRVMVGLTVFGVLHLLIQRKGWVYHLYPLAIGLACWGAWSLVALPMRRASVCLLITAATLVWVLPRSEIRRDMYPELRAATAMQRALESHLSPGARVQMFDSDSGAFLAMTRAGMRQATPYIQWFSLVLAGDSARRDFLASLQANPPAAVLLTSDQWPRPSGFEAADDWPEFNAILTSRYELQQTGRDERIAWRFYLRRAGE